LLSTFVINCQTVSNVKIEKETNSKKIKVYLLGSFHFAQTDSTYNVLDKKHQKSIDQLCKIAVSNNPNKVFVERQPEFESSNRLDSLYKIYQGLKRPLRAKNEIYQVGFRIAKMLNHTKVYQCDHPGRYGSLHSAATEYAENNNQKDILDRKSLGTMQRYDFSVNEDSIMQNSTLLEYIQWINSDQVMNSSHASYVTNYPLIGSTDFYNYDDDNTLIGADVITDWYRRNILIYTKMINQVDYVNDQAILLLMGADHIPILNYLFTTNPFFEVVPASEWLKE